MSGMLSCEACGRRLRGQQVGFCSMPCYHRNHRRKDPADLFWSKVERADDCWLWTGLVDVGGYGRAWDGSKMVKATRFSWFLATGRRVRRDLFVCHRCDNPRCVRPDHLFLAKQAGNMRDAVVKRRMQAGAEHWTHRRPELIRGRLTPDEIDHIRAEWTPGRTRELADRYGVHHQTIRNAVHRRSWRAA